MLKIYSEINEYYAYYSNELPNLHNGDGNYSSFTIYTRIKALHYGCNCRSQ